MASAEEISFSNLKEKRVLFLSSENFVMRFREKKEAVSLLSQGVKIKFLGVGDCIPEHLNDVPYEVEIIEPHEYTLFSTCGCRALRIVQNLTYYSCKRALLPYAKHFDFRHRWLSKTGKILQKNAKKWKPDVIHCVDAPTLGYAYYIAQKLGVPLVYDCSEWWQGVGEIMDLSNGSEFLDLVINEEKRYAKYASLTFTTSEEMSKRMKHQLCSRNTVVLYNSIPFPNPKYQEVHEPIRFVFHGTLAKNRGIIELLDALSRVCGDFELFLHGNYSDISKEDYQIYCRELKIQAKVHFCGPFDYQTIYGFLKNYDVAVWTSEPGKAHYDTTLPNKLFDAICSGLAVAMPDYKSIQDILNVDQVGRIIRTDTIETIAEELQFFIDNPEVVSQMKKKSVEVSEKYSWQEQEKRLLLAYCKLFKRGKF